MQPISFTCHQTIPKSAVDIGAEILDVSRWSDFKGYGLLPGIQQAEYQYQSLDWIGSRIRVQNTDGSEHTEEICQWIPGKILTMKLHEFTLPLSRMATHFTEEWTFDEKSNQETVVTRSFSLYAKNAWTRPLLQLIAGLLKQAIASQLAAMARQQP